MSSAIIHIDLRVIFRSFLFFVLFCINMLQTRTLTFYFCTFTFWVVFRYAAPFSYSFPLLVCDFSCFSDFSFFGLFFYHLFSSSCNSCLLFYYCYCHHYHYYIFYYTGFFLLLSLFYCLCFLFLNYEKRLKNHILYYLSLPPISSHSFPSTTFP